MRRHDAKAIQAYKNLHEGLAMALTAVQELTRAHESGSLQYSGSLHYNVLRKVAIRVCKAMRKLVTVSVDNEVNEVHIIEAYEDTSKPPDSSGIDVVES